MHLLFDGYNNTRQARSDSIKHTAITMIPNGPGSLDDDGIKPFLFLTSNPVTCSSPPVLKDRSAACGAIACKLRPCRTENQTCWLKTQDISKWSIVSSVWSHRGLAAGWLDPFLLVCQLSRISCELFQILSQDLNWMDPIQKASYADFVEKLPEVENCQMWVSSTSGCSSSPSRSSQSCKYSSRTSTVTAPFISVTHSYSQDQHKLFFFR